jgi:hypothetical protein
MLIFSIILAAIAIVTCFIASIVNAREGNFGSSFLMAILVGLNTYILITNINRLNNPQDEVETHVVKNVKEYYVDSTTVINGADTTKTYTITYLK